MRLLVVCLIMGSVWLQACTKEPPELPKEKVEFTSMILTFQESGSNRSFDLEYRDPEGDGNPVINTVVLKPNAVYNVTTTFLDESVAPARNVTDQVYINFEAYTVCYEPIGLDVLIDRLDGTVDSELGLTTRWTTTDGSEGNVLVTVAYQPEEEDNFCAAGEKQLEVRFYLTVREGTAPN